MSEGLNAAEQFVFELCRRSFLRLWSYANPQALPGSEVLAWRWGVFWELFNDCRCSVIVDGPRLIRIAHDLRQELPDSSTASGSPPAPESLLAWGSVPIISTALYSNVAIAGNLFDDHKSIVLNCAFSHDDG